VYIWVPLIRVGCHWTAHYDLDTAKGVASSVSGRGVPGVVAKLIWHTALDCTVELYTLLASKTGPWSCLLLLLVLMTASHGHGEGGLRQGHEEVCCEAFVFLLHDLKR
jgi:hypothetical protein